MSKYKVTRKEMRDKWGKNFGYVPNGTMQIFQSVISPVAYSTRAEGWACDYFEFSDFCVNEGYAPVGKELMSYTECEPYRKAYDEITRNYEWGNGREKMIANLLEDFKGDIRRKLA